MLHFIFLVLEIDILVGRSKKVVSSQLVLIGYGFSAKTHKPCLLPKDTAWGTGAPRREFLFVEDMAAASVFVMNLSADVYFNIVQPM